MPPTYSQSLQHSRAYEKNFQTILEYNLFGGLKLMKFIHISKLMFFFFSFFARKHLITSPKFHWICPRLIQSRSCNVRISYVCHTLAMQFSKHQPSGPMLYISQNIRLCVRLSVRLCVCVSVCWLLRYHLNIFLPPLPNVRCQKFIEILNPWGKVVQQSSLRFKFF